MKFTLTTLAISAAVTNGYRSEITLESPISKGKFSSPLPHTYLSGDDLPEAFSWGNKDGVSYLARSLNQHIPQYCGSCWAHGAISALADRIKIDRGASASVDVSLSVQYVLNNQLGGSCYGGSATGTYDALSAAPIPFETCQPYIACSSDSSEGFCSKVDTTASKFNTCRTCATFGTTCQEIETYPNATIGEYGVVDQDADKIKAEIYARGPVSAGVNAEPLLNYTGGVFSDDEDSLKFTNHIVSIVGWGKDANSGKSYWIVRNSWGEYWGDMGYFFLELGTNQLGIESAISWATPGTYSETNKACFEGGENCGPASRTYVDPSVRFLAP